MGPRRRPRRRRGWHHPRRGSIGRSDLDRWATDPDFWIRRSSLLAELKPLRNGSDLGPFLRRANQMLDEEFFIRKAIGWVLREVGKRRPDEVIAWLAPRTGRASGSRCARPSATCPRQTAIGSWPRTGAPAGRPGAAAAAPVPRRYGQGLREWRVRVPAFQALAHIGHEIADLGAIEDAVVE